MNLSAGKFVASQLIGKEVDVVIDTKNSPSSEDIFTVLRMEDGTYYRLSVSDFDENRFNGSEREIETDIKEKVGGSARYFSEHFLDFLGVNKDIYSYDCYVYYSLEKLETYSQNQLDFIKSQFLNEDFTLKAHYEAEKTMVVKNVELVENDYILKVTFENGLIENYSGGYNMIHDESDYDLEMPVVYI